MSRLHECLAKGMDNVPSTPHWVGVYGTIGDRMADLYLKAYESPRKGTRIKTKRKTAHALGHKFTDTRPWDVRNSGIASAKRQRAKEQAKLKKAVTDMGKGEAKNA
jgi:hypothetical protein